MRKSVKKLQKHEGFTLIELLIVVAIIGIIAAIAVPGLLRARMSGNEASAIGSVRAIHSGNTAYFSVCGGYAVSFNGAQGLAVLNYLPPEFNAAQPVAKSGYNFRLVAGNGAAAGGLGTGQCTGGQTTFYGRAEPVTVGSTGTRAFSIREMGTIYVDSTGAAIADAAGGPAIGGNVSILQ